MFQRSLTELTNLNVENNRGNKVSGLILSFRYSVVDHSSLVHVMSVRIAPTQLMR